MAYDDDPYRHQETGSADFGSPAAPEHRPPISPGGFPNVASRMFTDSVLESDRPSSTSTVVSTESPAGKDTVTAGPVERTSGARDRLLVHGLWELLLLAVTAGLGYLLWQADPQVLTDPALAQSLVLAAGFGLLGIAAGVSLRAGVPNLAIGPVAAAAGLYFAQRGGEGMMAPTVFALGLAVVGAVAVWLVVVLLRAPGWAVTLCAGAAVVVWLQLQPATVPLTGEFDPTGRATVLFAAVAVLAVLGGLLGSLRSIRRTFGQCRPDPVRRPPVRAVMLMGGVLLLSMTLPVIAGVLLTAAAGVPPQGSAGANWLLWTMVGLGVALLGGTSAYGRRGGVLGTILAVVALVLFHRYQQEQGWHIALLATATGMVLIGLLVTQLVERFGRPRQGEEENGKSDQEADPWQGSGLQDPDPTLTDDADAWSSALPARPAPAIPAAWEDDRWGRV